MEPTRLCLAFRMISERTWHKLRNNKISSIKISEETITEINLQDLDLLNLPHFKVVNFSKIVESEETGADWEWWFIQKNMNIGMAVQAKKINDDNHTYSIDYIPKRSKYPQIKRLLDYSQKMDLVPFYCFYNYWDLINDYETFWPCQSVEYKKELWGCSIAHGLVVYKLYKMSKKHINDIIPISQPLHCLSCCPSYWYDDFQSKSYGNRAAGISNLLYKHEKALNVDIDDYSNFKNPTPKEILPERISKLIHIINSNKIITEGFIKDYWHEDIPKSIVIIGDHKNPPSSHNTG